MTGLPERLRDVGRGTGDVWLSGECLPPVVLPDDVVPALWLRERSLLDGLLPRGLVLADLLPDVVLLLSVLELDVLLLALLELVALLARLSLDALLLARLSLDVL